VPLSHIQHFHALIQERNGWQQSITVQAIGIQIVGFEIGGGDKANAICKKRDQADDARSWHR
jgi:hypothetical protein